jgi:chromate transporter
MRDDSLAALAIVFIPFSLISVGGGSSIIAGMGHEAVDSHAWLTSKEFVELFAISRAAPGPGTMLATLIGWKVAGWTGALVASLALFIPSSLLCYGVFRLSNVHRDKRWHRAMRAGLAPVGTGLIAAGVLSILRLTGGGSVTYAIAVGSSVILVCFPNFPPLAVIGGGGLVALVSMLGAGR